MVLNLSSLPLAPNSIKNPPPKGPFSFCKSENWAPEMSTVFPVPYGWSVVRPKAKLKFPIFFQHCIKYVSSLYFRTKMRIDLGILSREKTMLLENSF